ncbi:plasmid IncI1-type surface exclusion protein ExcA [Salmonella enterica subsp. enterica serovar Newport]|nr:ethanolamine utilization protein EutE [Salmonella enterica subsp. diarizonae]EDJ8986983.1 ethanolamine utilization protein EutE [Salmonella enterica subsp. diarizonae]EJQ8147181.1 plasmid IncI1-type surface exclusion protein ExcA [Salmonella enterica subsp. enterica serovar Newport]EJW0496353.1 plasmid IncI1-type surface exclusion protein ExcA [Salmonella enterica subsp. enterica serovar Newport]ELA5318085.1 plasmid IncI1-type surface exclusion protein ExcA [Salmonella enterica subsp. enteri
MKERLPFWYRLISTLFGMYFMLGVPFLLFYGIASTASIMTDRHTPLEGYIYAYGSWFLIIAPCIWLYLLMKKRQQKIDFVVNSIKATGFFSPDKKLECRLKWQGVYFGIDIKNGTMLYVAIWPGKLMDIIGFQTGGSKETVVTDGHIEIYTDYVSLPSIKLQLWLHSPKLIANTIHTMNRKEYNHTVNFPQLVKDKEKEFGNVTGLTVSDLY